MTTLEYHNDDGTSNKFWSIFKDEKSKEIVINWGKRGSSGRVTRYPYTSEFKANREIEKMIKKKREKGYKTIWEDQTIIINQQAAAPKPKKQCQVNFNPKQVYFCQISWSNTKKPKA